MFKTLALGSGLKLVSRGNFVANTPLFFDIILTIFILLIIHEIQHLVDCLAVGASPHISFMKKWATSTKYLKKNYIKALLLAIEIYA